MVGSRTYRQEVLRLRDADEEGGALREARQDRGGEELLEVIASVERGCYKYN